MISIKVIISTYIQQHIRWQPYIYDTPILAGNIGSPTYWLDSGDGQMEMICTEMSHLPSRILLYKKVSIRF